VPQFQTVFSNFRRRITCVYHHGLSICPNGLQSGGYSSLYFLWVAVRLRQGAREVKKIAAISETEFCSKLQSLVTSSTNAVARYARTLSTTFAAGVPLSMPADSVAGAAGNVVFYNAVMQIKEDVIAGSQLNFLYAAPTNVFPHSRSKWPVSRRVQATWIGMPRQSRDYYRSEVDTL